MEYYINIPNLEIGIFSRANLQKSYNYLLKINFKYLLTVTSHNFLKHLNIF